MALLRLNRPGVAAGVVSLLLLSILLRCTLFVPSVKAAGISVVGTTTDGFAVSESNQRKAFYANGLFWVFYDDGTNMVYQTSTDGSTWSSVTVVRATGSFGGTHHTDFSVWFDGTYMSYACARWVSGEGIFYRRGTPNSNGTITWSDVEQDLTDPWQWGEIADPYVSVDSNGYPWIGYLQFQPSSGVYYYYPYVIKSSLNNGTWSTDSGFPYQLSSIYTNTWDVTILPLTAGKMYAIYGYSNGQGRGQLWNGTAWGIEETTTTGTFIQGDYHSAVAVGDNVYLAYLDSYSQDILYDERTWGVGWSNETTIQSPYVTGNSAPVLSVDPNSGNLYCFWVGSPTYNHIFYKACVGGTWDSNPTDWITDSLNGFDKLTCFYQAWNSSIGLAYVNSTSSPYQVRFAFLTMPPLAIGQFQPSSGRININSYFYLNATVYDQNGVNDLKNATLTLNSTVNLNWFNSTWSFTKTGDAGSYCTLGTNSFNSTVDSNSYKLSWNVTFNTASHWNITSAIVWGSSGNGTSSARALPEFSSLIVMLVLMVTGSFSGLLLRRRLKNSIARTLEEKLEEQRNVEEIGNDNSRLVHF